MALQYELQDLHLQEKHLTINYQITGEFKFLPKDNALLFKDFSQMNVYYWINNAPKYEYGHKCSMNTFAASAAFAESNRTFR